MNIGRFIIICLLTIKSYASTNDSSIESKSTQGMYSPMKMVFYQLPQSLNPTHCWLVEHLLIVQAVSQSLIRIDEKGSFQGDLATRWHIENGKKYTFYLDKHATFHDGTPITARDVALSLSQHFYPDTKSIVKRYLKEAFGATPTFDDNILSNLKIIDKNTLQVNLENPFPPFLKVLAMGNFSVYKNVNGKLVFSGPMIPKSYTDEETDLRGWELTHRDSKRKNKILVLQSNNFPQTYSLLKNNKIQLMLGFSVSDVLDESLSNGLRISKVNSLATSHMYYNTTQPLFTDSTFREDFGRFIQSEAKKHSNMLTKFSPYFLPRGVLSYNYYNSHKFNALNKSLLLQKWGNRLKGKTIKIVLMKRAFASEFVSSLKYELESLGLSVDLVLCNDQELMHYLKNPDYDIIGGRFMAGFSDPEGFLNSISEESPLHYGVFNTKWISDEIDSKRPFKSSIDRTEAYDSVISKYEDSWGSIPLFRFYVPIIHAKDIKLPNSEFRFVAEIWKISHDK
ncbi:ABC transporter substrate-binding protein [Zooshikella harenae]|uniref:Solute-binding protein family 5 domain-containing protein n=1 Tax=Zooshikella harenae TaxID=2827238 RepID=A0ABS5ZDK4_9GAMM|nr:ABC transporter substrate-binding protein [Zooshikella harenae]MBU2712070.1 hypothetical protein [Zooshikella harenae]